jgi:hypothetical protein
MRSGDGLAAVAYAPSQVALEIGGIPVMVTLETDYPFRDSLRFTVQTEQPVSFPLSLRIPAWAQGASVQVAADAAQEEQPGQFHSLERTWRGTTTLELRLPMTARLQNSPSGAAALERGPLVYALKIGEDWRRVHADLPYRELPHADWEVYPTTAWNYALQVSAVNIGEAMQFQEMPVGERPFSPEGAPVQARLKGRRLPEWLLHNGSAGTIPPSPARQAAGGMTLIVPAAPTCVAGSCWVRKGQLLPKRSACFMRHYYNFRITPAQQAGDETHQVNRQPIVKILNWWQGHHQVFTGWAMA